MQLPRFLKFSAFIAALLPLAAWGNAGSPITYAQNGQLVAELVSNGGTFDHTVAPFDVLGTSAPFFAASAAGNTTVGGFPVTPVGTAVSLGSYTAGTELYYELHNYVPGSPVVLNSVSTGTPSFLPVFGLQAATITYSGGGLIATIAFDELASGVGPYDDLTFTLTLSPLAAVPEPSTYALMLAGLGFVGFVTHRRRVQSRA